MLLADFKDAVATGNGEYLSVIRYSTTVNGLLQSIGKVELATLLKLTYFRRTGTVK